MVLLGASGVVTDYIQYSLMYVKNAKEIIVKGWTLTLTLKRVASIDFDHLIKLSVHRSFLGDIKVKPAWGLIYLLSSQCLECHQPEALTSLLSLALMKCCLSMMALQPNWESTQLSTL